MFSRRKETTDMKLLNRRCMIGLAVAAAVTPSRAAAPAVFLHNEGCGCCHQWAGHMARAGLPVAMKATDDLAAAHLRLGLAEAYHTCHVGEIGGYVISGHVPPADIQRMLAVRPDAVGLVVTGMPVGSPGMEHQDQLEAYEVLLIAHDGSSTVLARYG